MKLKAYTALCAASMLALTACTAEDPIVPGGAGGNVTFTLHAPGLPGTRADAFEYGDGHTAQDLEFHVYELTADFDVIKHIATGHDTMRDDLTQTVSLNLVNGKTYGIVWLAQADGLYEYDLDAHTITVDYTGAHNNEARDAFYAYSTLTVTGATSQDVTLKRPFAQVNFGTSDFVTEAEHKQNYDILCNAFGANNFENLHTQLAMEDVPTELNLMTGEVNTTSKLTTVKFDPTVRPGEEHAFPYTGKDSEGKAVNYKHLAMNYILAPAGGSLHTLDFAVLKGNQETDVYNRISVANAPLKANYRTNIFGRLLTSATDFDVEIKPIFAGENLYDVENPPLFAGEGTPEEPFKLNSPDDIRNLFTMYNAIMADEPGAYEKYYRATFDITQDIDMTDVPMCNLGIGGCLINGNGHTLKVNLRSDAELGRKGVTGLFYSFNGAGNSQIHEATADELDSPFAYEYNGKTYIIEAGCIRDLKIEGTIYANSGDVSPLGMTQNTGYIINVENHADIICEGTASFVGGITCGTRGTGLLIGCKNYGNITVNNTTPGQGRIVGGITAQLFGGSAANGTYPDIAAPYTASCIDCHNYGNITANGDYVGGIVGQTHGYGANRGLINCTNTGNITGTTKVGGIIGGNPASGTTLTLLGNVNTGIITATAEGGFWGNIIGWNEGVITEDSVYE